MNAELETRLKRELEGLRASGMHRSFRDFSTPQAPRCVIGGKDTLVFASNSYLGLSGDERLVEAGKEALSRWGTGSGGSRLTTGGYTVHRELEEETARLKGKEAALLYGTGFQANVGVITAFAGRDWVVYCDKLNHASIIDGCRLSGAEFAVYRHADAEDLAHKAERFRDRPGLLVTDGVFSMDGDLAPLRELLAVARRFGLLSFLDDAHGSGVLGASGAGSASHSGAHGEFDLVLCTYSKAYASQGAAVCGSALPIDWLVNKSRGFIFSTALPPHVAAVSLAALRVSQSEEWRRTRLAELSARLRSRLRGAGLDVPDGITPIVPVIIGGVDETVRASRKLWEEGVYVPAIRPPTVKEGTSRLRVSLMSTHTESDVDFAADAILRATGRI